MPGKNLVVRINDEQRAALQKMANSQGVKVAVIVRDVIDRLLTNTTQDSMQAVNLFETLEEISPRAQKYFADRLAYGAGDKSPFEVMLEIIVESAVSRLLKSAFMAKPEQADARLALESRLYKPDMVFDLYEQMVQEALQNIWAITPDAAKVDDDDNDN